MSFFMTIRRVFDNPEYLTTIEGILKISQLVLGIVNVGLVSSFYNKNVEFHTAALTFFLLMAVTFLISTFVTLLSCIVSTSTASALSETIYEFIYHGLASILYLAASINLITETVTTKTTVYVYYHYYEECFAASMIGFILALLYGISTFFGFRSYKKS